MADTHECEAVAMWSQHVLHHRCDNTSQPGSASQTAEPADLLGYAQVDKDLRQMLIKSDAPPAKKIGVRVWPKAIPQFNVGHLEVVQVKVSAC